MFFQIIQPSLYAVQLHPSAIATRHVLQNALNKMYFFAGQGKQSRRRFEVAPRSLRRGTDLVDTARLGTLERGFAHPIFAQARLNYAASNPYLAFIWQQFSSSTRLRESRPKVAQV